MKRVSPDVTALPPILQTPTFHSLLRWSLQPATFRFLSPRHADVIEFHQISADPPYSFIQTKSLR